MCYSNLASSALDKTDDQVIVTHLIQEELKSRKFFNTLRTVGLDDAFYQTDLCNLILAHFELDAEANAVLDFYYQLFEKHSAHVEANRSSLEQLAEAVYRELESYRPA